MKRTDWLLCLAKNCDWFKFKIQKIQKNLNRALSSSVRLSSNRSCVSQSRFLYEGVKHFEVSVSQSKKSKCLGSQRKTLVSPSRKVSHLPFATPTIILLALMASESIAHLAFDLMGY